MQFTEQERSKRSVMEVRRRGRGQVETEDGASKMERRRRREGWRRRKRSGPVFIRPVRKRRTIMDHRPQPPDNSI